MTLANFAGMLPRRNVLIPTACVVLLLLVWSFRLPPSTFAWLDIDAVPPSPISTGSKAVPPASKLDGGPPTSSGPHSQKLDYDLSDPEAPFIGWPLQRVCNEQKHWVEGLVYICDNNSGGIGNMRNYIQTCIRYAIESGAMSLVVPKIRKRSDVDLAELFTDYLPLTYMFDADHFKTTLSTYCPQITLYEEVRDIPNVKEMANEDPKAKRPKYEPKIEEISPKDIVSGKGCDWRDQNRHTDQFNIQFRKWLARTGGQPNIARPRLIRFKWGILFNWPVIRDGAEFANTFGSLLRIHPEYVRLGKTALQKMRALAESKGLDNGRFLGFHLRSENDAMDFWPHYDRQEECLLSKSKQLDLKVAFMATGNATEAAKLSAAAGQKAGMTVVTKHDLLDETELAALSKLTWDQQGLVDYFVLLASDYFVGVHPSSFSISIAMARHLKTEGLYSRQYKAGTEEGDGHSFVLGDFDEYFDQWGYMWDGIWP